MPTDRATGGERISPPAGVKAEAVSIYRKLGAASRSVAIQRAVEVGLLENTIYPPRPTRSR